MYIRFLILFCFFFNVSTLFSQNSFRNKYFFPSIYSSESYATTIEVEPDGYVLAGHLEYDNVDFDIVSCVMKVNLVGDIQWIKKVGSVPGQTRLSTFSKLRNGGYLMAGQTDNFTSGSFIIKMDGSGNFAWQKEITSYSSNFKSLETPQNDLIISFNNRAGFSLLKLDSNANHIWTKKFGVTDSCFVDDLINTNDFGYIVISHYHTRNGTNILKLDSAGNINWSKNINYAFSNIVQGPTGDLFLSRGMPINNFNFILVRLSSNADTLWTKGFTGSNSETITGLQATDDNGIILTGYLGNGSYGTLGVKVDSTGSLNWSKVIGGSFDNAIGEDIKKISSNEYVVFSECFGDSLFLLSKIDSTGFSGCAGSNDPLSIQPFSLTIVSDSIDLFSLQVSLSDISFVNDTMDVNKMQICSSVGVDQLTSSLIQIYPNPFCNQFSISETNPNGVVLVYDLAGNICKQQLSTINETQISAGSLIPGFYIICYKEEGRVLFSKALKVE